MDNENNDSDERHLAELFGKAWDNGTVNRERARKWWKVSLETRHRERMAQKRRETGVGGEFSEKIGRSGG